MRRLWSRDGAGGVVTDVLQGFGLTIAQRDDEPAVGRAVTIEILQRHRLARHQCAELVALIGERIERHRRLRLEGKVDARIGEGLNWPHTPYRHPDRYLGR